MIELEGGGGGGGGGEIGRRSGRVAVVVLDEAVASDGERGPAPVVRRVREAHHAARAARAGQLRQARGARPVSIEQSGTGRRAG